RAGGERISEGVPAEFRTRPGAQLLYRAGGRFGARGAGHGAAAASGADARTRSECADRSGAGLPLLRAAGGVGGGARTRAATGSVCPDQRRLHVLPPWPVPASAGSLPGADGCDPHRTGARRARKASGGGGPAQRERAANGGGGASLGGGLRSIFRGEIRRGRGSAGRTAGLRRSGSALLLWLSAGETAAAGTRAGVSVAGG